MFRRAGFDKSVKGEVKATECHVCKENGESIQVYGGHNFRDPKGRIVCSNFLEKNKKSGCNVMQKLSKFIFNLNKKNEINEINPTFENDKEVIDDSSDDEFEKLYPYITVRSKLALQIPEPWSDSDDD
jgi:hypothetical protein